MKDWSWTTIKCHMEYFCKTMPNTTYDHVSNLGRAYDDFNLSNPMMMTFLGNWSNDTMHVMMEKGHLILHDTKGGGRHEKLDDVDDMEHTYKGCHNLARHVRYKHTMANTHTRVVITWRDMHNILHKWQHTFTRVVITWWDMCDILHTMATK